MAKWSTNTSSSSVIHSVQLDQPQPFTVLNNHIQDATVYYGMTSGSAVTWQTTHVSTAHTENGSFTFFLGFEHTTELPNYRSPPQHQ
jgi:hypothetical protein